MLKRYISCNTDAPECNSNALQDNHFHRTVA